MQVLPILRSDEIWQHPAIAAAFDTELRDRLRAAADQVDKWLDELDDFPLRDHATATTARTTCSRARAPTASP